MDIYGAYIGCSSLYVIQTNSVIQPYKNLNDTWNLANDLRNGKKHPNWKKITYWVGTGIAIGAGLTVAWVVCPPAGASLTYFVLTGAGAAGAGIAAYAGDPCYGQGFFV
ncbi:MAG: hypothetical protein Q8R66_03850 [Methanobacteriaceae archaeon]|nr:hypothetical protein [Methanobacteriaceae archaeon]